MTKKRVLIAGAAGFIGSHLCDRFMAEGYQVIAMDNLLTGDLANIEHLFKEKDFEYYHHDVTKFIHVPGKLDYILNFASPASPIDYLQMPIQTLKVGAHGTHNLLPVMLTLLCQLFRHLFKRCHNEIVESDIRCLDILAAPREETDVTARICAVFH